MNYDLNNDTLLMGKIDTPCVSFIKDNDDIIMVTKKINENDLNGPYVEIAGISWASCNLGATRPCEYGDYYMWGSTKPNNNDNCDWVNTPFNNGSKNYEEDYFASIMDTVCPNGVLAAEYDAIYQSTEGFARIPTKEEFQSLIDNTTKTVCDCTYMGGDNVQHTVRGLLFTSKNDESKKIFIPFSGYRYGGSFNYRGSYGYVWSSSVYSDYVNGAWGLGFDSSSCEVLSFSRYDGRCLRGVKNSK